MATKKPSKLTLELEKAISKLLKEVMTVNVDPKDNASLTDKMKVFDRALKFEALKQKVQDDAWGKGFFNDDEDGGLSDE